MVQWLRLCAPNAGDLGLILGWETRSYMLPLKIPNGRTKTWCRGRKGGREREKEEGRREGGIGKRRRERREGGRKEGARISISLRCMSSLPPEPPSQGERNRKWPTASGTGERDCPLRQQGSGQQCTWLNVPSLEEASSYKEAPNSLDFRITLQGAILPSVQETRPASITARRTKVIACVPCAKSFAKLPP